MNSDLIKILGIGFLMLTSFGFAKKLTKNEKKLLKTIEANNDDAIVFLKKVINIKSGTMNHAGVKEVGMVFKEAYALSRKSKKENARVKMREIVANNFTTYFGYNPF